MKKIPLTQGKFAIVDDGDYDWLSQFKWCAHKHHKTYYAQSHGITMHRKIMGLEKGDGKQIDHVDRNGLNNQRSNLRIATQQENTFNRGPVGKSSKYKGVCWHTTRNKWEVRIKHNDKTIHLGVHKDEVLAAKAYDKKAKELFGDHAYLNFTS